MMQCEKQKKPILNPMAATIVQMNATQHRAVLISIIKTLFRKIFEGGHPKMVKFSILILFLMVHLFSFPSWNHFIHFQYFLIFSFSFATYLSF